MPDKPLFPTNLIPLLGVELPDTFQTVRPGEDCPSLIALRRWDTPKMRRGRLKYTLGTADLEDLMQFWASVKGGGTAFDFVWPLPDVWHGLYVGVGDGSTDAFDLPGLGTSARAMYKDGVAGTPTYSTGTGENGRDQGTFVTAPVDGALVTCDFTGYRVIVAVMEDEMAVREVGDGFYEVTVRLDEV